MPVPPQPRRDTDRAINPFKRHRLGKQGFRHIGKRAIAQFRCTFFNKQPLGY